MECAIITGRRPYGIINMKAAFVASEITPYASTGGLADVAAALPEALSEQGVDTLQIMPMYRRVMEGPYHAEDTGIVLSIPVGFHNFRAEIWTLPRRDPPIYFIRRDEFFDRSELYNLSHRDYEDNFERFIFFQKAAIALLDHLGANVDIVHCHDWQTGLVPLYLKHGMKGEGRHGKEKTVFTIHNLAYQGRFSGHEYSYTNLPFSCFSVDCLEYYGDINCMKAGITASDYITTVSKSYAREIQTEAWGQGLHGVLTDHQARMRGILNGIDTHIWNPDTDKAIARTYSRKDLSGKRTCKQDLIERMKLKISPETPLIGIVSRLADQKGMDILAEAMESIMQMDVGFVLLGSGQDKYQDQCRKWVRQWPGRVSVRIGFDVRLAHQIEAGCDIFLMPSKFEPCGLNQLYSLRYGTIPVVHQVGGLADTVIDIHAFPNEGYGFSFQRYLASELTNAVDRAVDAYRRPAMWSTLQDRAMQQDFSWNRSAREYRELYQQLVRSPSVPSSSQD